VLMHDGTVDRTTTGHGEVARMTFEELRKLGVPTFDEALELARGKIGIYVDCKRVAAADLVAAIDRAGMGDRVVIYGGAGLLKEVAALQPTWRVMPEAGNAEQLASLVEALHLKIAAFDARDFVDPVIQVAKKARIGIFVDRLGAADNEAAWADAIARGATGIQTDHPAELVAFLKARGLR